MQLEVITECGAEKIVVESDISKLLSHRFAKPSTTLITIPMNTLFSLDITGTSQTVGACIEAPRLCSDKLCTTILTSDPNVKIDGDNLVIDPKVSATVA